MVVTTMINIHSNENSDARKHWSVREHGPCMRKGCEKSYGCGNGAVQEHGAVREKRYGHEKSTGVKTEQCGNLGPCSSNHIIYIQNRSQPI